MTLVSLLLSIDVEDVVHFRFTTPLIVTFSMLLAILPASNILLSIGVVQSAKTLALVVLELSFVNSSILPQVCSFAVLLPICKVAEIGASICELE